MRVFDRWQSFDDGIPNFGDALVDMELHKIRRADRRSQEEEAARIGFGNLIAQRIRVVWKIIADVNGLMQKINWC